MTIAIASSNECPKLSTGKIRFDHDWDWAEVHGETVLQCYMCGEIAATGPGFWYNMPL